MARTINKNQYRKVYPRIRKRPQYATLGAAGVAVETALLTFSGTSEATYTFTKTYTQYPVVSAVAAGDDNNINLFISSISTTSVTISASTPFHGTGHLVAVARST
jgi:hypothetical protein